MWDSLLLDFLYLSSDFMTGKSIPVLLAVTSFPIDPHLMGTMVLVGCLGGALVNWYRQSRMTSYVLLELLLRWVNLTLSCYFSILFIQRLLHLILPVGGMGPIGTIPTFWVILHGNLRNTKGEMVSEKAATLWMLFLMSVSLFYLGLLWLHPADFSGTATPLSIGLETPLTHPRGLLAMSRKDWATKYYPTKHEGISPIHYNPHHQVHKEVSSSLPASLVILITSLYSTVNHGPFYQYTGKLCSPALLYHRTYAFLADIFTALFRAYVILTIGWIHTNVIHLVIEGSHYTSTGGLAGIYLIVAMYSTQWNLTLLMHQVLTVFQGDPDGDMRFRYLVFLFALAYMTYLWQEIHLALFITAMFLAVVVSVQVSIF